MEELTKNVVNKISSYNIFNNLLPGIAVCCLVESSTRFSLTNRNLLEKLFLYYFVGMIVSRIGSVIVEKCLKSLKIKSKKTNNKEPFLRFAPYEQYEEASEMVPFIKELNKENNSYRSVIAVFLVVIVVKLYDWLLYDYVMSCGIIAENVAFVVGCMILVLIFAFGYRKQTDYIRRRVEKYIISKEMESN